MTKREILDKLISLMNAPGFDHDNGDITAWSSLLNDLKRAVCDEEMTSRSDDDDPVVHVIVPFDCRVVAHRPNPFKIKHD